MNSRQDGSIRASMHTADSITNFNADGWVTPPDADQPRMVPDHDNESEVSSPETHEQRKTRRRKRNKEKSDAEFRSAVPYDSLDSGSTGYKTAGSAHTSKNLPKSSRKHHSEKKHHKKSILSNNRQKISLEYTEKSKVSGESKLRSRRRSKSIEVRYEIKPPPAEPRSAPRIPGPCIHKDWNQAYEPGECESEDSRVSSEEGVNSYRVNTRVYEPEPLQLGSSENTSVVRKLSRGLEEDRALKTQVTITEKHRKPIDDEMAEHNQGINLNRGSDEIGLAKPRLVGSEKLSIKKIPPFIPQRSKSSNEPGDYISFNLEQNTHLSLKDKLKAKRTEAGLANSDDETKPHAFPFKQTESGNIKAKPDQLAFESNKVAVLISDPRKTLVNISQDSTKTWKQVTGETRPPTVPTLPLDVLDENNEYHERPRSAPREVQIPATAGQGKYKWQSNGVDAHIQDSDFSDAIARANNARNKSSSVQTQTLPVSFSDRHEEIYAAQYDDCGDQKNFFEKIHNRIKRAINPDTIINVGGHKFACHAIALQCYSKFFDRKKRSIEKIMEVEIPERIMSPKEFRDLMDWVIIGESQKKLGVTQDNVVGLFSGAVYLEMPDLREDCLHFVRERLDQEDPAVLKIYEEASRKNNCQPLVSLLSTKLSALFPKLYKSQQFLQMDAKDLITLLKSDTINIKSELDVHDAAARWLLYDWNARKGYTVPVMSTVRFGLLSPLQLTQMRHTGGLANMADYANIYTFKEVRKMLDDGLSYAIFRENFRNKEGDLNRWIDISKVEAPRPRYHVGEEPDINRIPGPISFPDERNYEYRRDSTRKHSGRDKIEKSSRYSEDFLSTRELSRTRNYPEPNTRRNTDDVEPISKSVRRERRSYRNVPDEKYKFKIDVDEEGTSAPPSRRDLRIRAAILIQTKVRAWLTRRWFRQVKIAAIIIQRAFRAHRLRIHNRKKYSPMKAPKSAPHLTLQQHYIASAPQTAKLTLEDSTAFIIFGGHDPIQPIGRDNTAADVYQLHVNRNIWNFVGTMPEPRIHGGAVRNGRVIILFGGADPRYRSTTDKLVPVGTTWALDVETGKWKKLGSMNVARRNFGYASSSGRIFVFGGVGEDGDTLKSCECYEPDYNTWTIIQPMDGPRTCMGVVKHDGLIWLAGGMSKYQSYPLLKSVVVYNVRQNRFSPAPSLPRAICYPTLASYGRQLFLIGGAGKVKGTDSSQSLRSILKYDAHEGWKFLTNLTTPRHGHCQINMGKYIALFGGINSFQREALDTVETFNLEKFTTRTGIAPMPRKLTGLNAIILH